jgi:hypothetical protein
MQGEEQPSPSNPVTPPAQALSEKSDLAPACCGRRAGWERPVSP